MPEQLLYLSRADVAALAIPPAELRDAVLQAFRDHAAGRIRSVPKLLLDLGPGHGFLAMPAASAQTGVATLKWVAMAPVPAGSAAQGVNGLILVNDHATGRPLAVLDGDEITLLRTAAISAAAASLLMPGGARTIGFAGCGAQAHAHLEAFLALWPSLERAVALSRSSRSAERLAAAAESRGLCAETTADPDALLAEADVVISTVPGAPGLEPFLDARRMRADTLAVAVDLGRSWLPDSFPAFDRLVTDSLAQSTAPYDVTGQPVDTARFGEELVQLAEQPPRACGRTLFCFRGVALADLAAAALVLERARVAGSGTLLPR